MPEEKSMKEEEDLEEMTDDKLEEVEKLKAWELWLNERQSPLWNRIINKDLSVIPIKFQEIIKYTTNAGDARFGNQHESGQKASDIIDDKQIYIGKPSDKNKEKEKEKKENDDEQ